MGKRIVHLFEQADAIGGLVARMRLASLAQVTSMEAETLEDQPDLVNRAQHALEEIRKQFAAARDEKPSPAPSPSGAEPLAGQVVVIDPGHNPGNFRHPSEINRQVDIGTNRKECDTTGTSTNAGYAEAEFSLDVARRMRAVLVKLGATV